MKREQVEQKILEELERRSKRTVNRNAIRALMGAFGGPGDALGRIILGREDALGAERSQIAQGIMLDLLCKIDDALVKAEETASKQGLDWTVLAGTIEAHGMDVEDVTGARIEDSAGPVELKPGTRIRATGTRSKRVTGVQVGGNGRKEDKHD